MSVRPCYEQTVVVCLLVISVRTGIIFGEQHLLKQQSNRGYKRDNPTYRKHT